MAGFTEIIGQEQLKEQLQNGIRMGKVSHAYIINGEKHAGKEFIAGIFAMALQCEKEEGKPCQECHSCRQALSHNHPDIIRVTHEKPNTIGVEDIRRQITGDMGIRPYTGPYKIYNIGEGEKMTIQAQNALLKTLEEPPAYGVILILTDNVNAMLPTILSRCVVLHMKPVEDKLVKQYLMESMEIPDYKADICVAFARGNIGKAKLLAASEEFDNIREDAMMLMKYIGEMEMHEIIAAVKKINEYKLEISDYLDIIAIWYRDVLLFKATNDVNHLIFKDEIQYIKKAAGKSDYAGIENILKGLEKAKSRLAANVNFDLTMELLLLTIQEN